MFNLFVPSVFVEQVLLASYRGAAWNKAGVIPDSNSRIISGVEGGPGHFSVWLFCPCCSLQFVATCRFFLPT